MVATHHEFFNQKVSSDKYGPDPHGLCFWYELHTVSSVGFVFLSYSLWQTWTRETSLKRVFISGWIAQFIFNLIGFHWIANTAVEFGHLPWPIAMVVLFLYCAHANIHLPLAGVLWVKFFKNRTRLSALLGLACITATLELIYPEIFTWNFGYPLFWYHVPIYNFADVIGFQGLSLVVLIINALFAFAWIHRRRTWSLTWVTVGVLVLNIVGFAWGVSWPEADSKIRFSIVQANIGNFEKFASIENADFRPPLFKNILKSLVARCSKTQTPTLFCGPKRPFRRIYMKAF